MHIVLLNDDRVPDARGGSALVAQWEREELSAAGHKVTLITTHQKGEEEIDLSDALGRIISIRIAYPLQQRHRKCLKIPAVSEKLDALLSKLKPDVVHAHTIHTYLTYDALRIARKHTQQIFMTAHDTFLVSFGRVRNNNPGRMYFWNHLSAVGRCYWPLRNRAIKKAIKDSGTTIISISNTLDSFLQKNGIAPSVVIPNGIPLTQPPPSKAISNFRIKHKLTGPTILYGGRINEDKGIGVLLCAMEQVLLQIPNAELLIVGEYKRLLPHLSSASESVKRSVKATDWLPQSQMHLAYGATDVVVTPSIYFDAFNLMNIEAMNAYKPVIGTCFGGTIEIVEDGVTGYIRNPLDTDVFATALIELLTKKDLAKNMGVAGRKRVEEIYSLENHINSLLQIFTK